MSLWGNLVLRRITSLSPLLVAGCSATPPPEPPPQPPPAPPVVSSAPPAPKAPEVKADPAGAEPGLSAFRMLFAGSPTATLGLRGETLVPFGKGVLAYGSMFTQSNMRPPECLVGGGKAGQCHFLRIAPWARPVVGWGFLEPPQESSLGAWSGLKPAQGAWDGAMSAGREVVYAVRFSSGLEIDTINEKGEVKQILSAAVPLELSGSEVVETSKGLVLAGLDGASSEVVFVPFTGSDDGKGSVKEVARTGVTMLPYGATAAWARGMKNAKNKVGFGGWSVAPSLDAKGEPEGAFYLAWIEVLPPAKYTPAGVAPRKGGKSKNGCGRGSRSLSDISVEKKAHVSKFSAEGKKLDDRVVQLGISADEEPKLKLVPTSYGYTLNGVAYGRDGVAKKDAQPARSEGVLTASPAFKILPVQHLAGAAYDQAKGEGIAVVAEENRQVLIRFDATGEPVGEQSVVEGRLALPPLSSRSLALAGDAWAALEASNDVVQVLTGHSAGKRINIPSAQSWLLARGVAWALPLDDDRIEIVRYVALPHSLLEAQKVSPSARHVAGPLVSRVDLKRGEATPWELVPGWFVEEQGVVSPRLEEVLWAGRGEGGALTLLGKEGKDAVALLRLSDGSWSKAVPLGEGAPKNNVRVRDVWKDQAVLFDGSNSVVSWLSKGLTVQVGRAFGAAGMPARNDGPWLRPGEWVLGGEASEPFKVPAKDTAKDAAKVAYNGCVASFPTGPRRVVLLCVEPPADQPGARVGSRVIRF